MKDPASTKHAKKLAKKQNKQKGEMDVYVT
jgi:hypothetical protein